MTGHVLLAAALLTVALAVAFVIGAAGRALILAVVRHREPPRHAIPGAPPRRIYDRTEKPPGDKAQREAAYATLAAELRALPAPGRDIYTDHSVWLPRTPQTSPAGPVPGEEPRLRTGRQPDGPPHRDAGRTWVKDRPGTPPPGPDADADVEEWRHILAPAERLATDTDVRATLCGCGRPAGHFRDTLLTGSLDAIGHAFDTAQFPAVTV